MKFNATKSQKSKKGLCSLEFQLVELADKITFPFFMASLIGNENDANSFLCHLSPFDRPDSTAGMWGCKILWGMYGSQFQANVVPNLAFGECYLSFRQMCNFLQFPWYTFIYLTQTVQSLKKCGPNRACHLNLAGISGFSSNTISKETLETFEIRN